MHAGVACAERLLTFVGGVMRVVMMDVGHGAWIGNVRNGAHGVYAVYTLFMQV